MTGAFPVLSLCKCDVSCAWHLVDAGLAQVDSSLQGLDDLLVVRGILPKADLQLTQETPAALKCLLLLKLDKQERRGEWNGTEQRR